MILHVPDWRAALSPLARLGCAVVAALAVWFLARCYDGSPQPQGWDAPKAAFSAARAGAVLERILGPQLPHPTSSAENDSIRVRIIYEFSVLGIDTHVDRGFACNGAKRGNIIACGTVNNIVADLEPGEGKAIVLLAHYDSVAAGPGAADDGAGVAAIVEIARALKASGSRGHPILAVITDGEESGLLGAKHFLDNPENKKRVGVVLNVEARGNRGPSLLFQTGDGNAKLIDLYARNTRAYATSSLFPAIYKLIPNDTDLTVFLNEGFQGLNFACIGNFAYYHTPLDRRENLNSATLQHHGENLLGMTRALAKADFVALGGDDAIFISIFGRWLPRLNAAWAVPLSILAFLAVIAAWFMEKGRGERSWPVILLPPAVILLALLADEALWTGARVMAEADPSAGQPVALRIAYSLSVLLAAVVCGRWAGERGALAVWTWMTLWSVAAAVLLPGASPYFLFPALVGGFAVLLKGRAPDAVANGLLALAAGLSLVVWMQVAVQGEALMGLSFQPLFTLPAVLAILPLVPFARLERLEQRRWAKCCAALAAAGLVAAVIAGFQPAYSDNAPQRLNIALVDDHTAGKAMWIVDTAGALPAGLRAAAGFPAERTWSLPMRTRPAYAAEAGALRFPAPDTDVDQLEDGALRLTVTFGDTFVPTIRFVVVPAESDLQSVEIGGNRFEAAAEGPTVIACTGDDCATKPIVLRAPRPFDLAVAGLRYGLPEDAAALVKARPSAAVPSSVGDTTIVLGKISIVPAKPATPL